MTADIAFVLALMVVAVVLFSLERMPVDVVALGLLVSLVVGGVLDARSALAGFANEAVVAIAGLLVLGAALRTSGAIDRIAAWAARRATGGPRGAVAMLVLVVTSVSSFLSNTTATATFLPLGIGIARAHRISPSRVLMPLAFASILGGTVTLVGTSTNLIVSGMLPGWDQPPLRMFELAPVAVPIAVAGVAYLVWIAPRLLPDRAEVDLGRSYALPEYLAEVEVLAGSPLAGVTVADSRLGRDFDITLLRIVRGVQLVRPGPGDTLHEGDRLLVEGRLDTLVELEAAQRLALVRGDAAGAAAGGLAAPGEKLIEVVVLPRSNLIGRTLREVDFRNRYDTTVLAINRHAERLVSRLGDLPIGVGDVLLIQGDEPALARFLALPGLLVLSDRAAPPGAGPQRAWLAPAAFAGVVLLAATGVLPLAIAVLLGCLAMVGGGVLSPREAYEAVDWSLVVLIASMIGYGQAMGSSGAAALLAAWLAGWSADFGPLAMLAGFYLLTVILTQPMSNQAAALVVLPVALGVAAEVGIGSRAMAVTVALAASSSFLTPLEPSCLLVYAPGRYRFFDFTRVGAGLTLIAFVLTLLLVPRLWPL
ncbi:MAG TPA: SLC13 family permease [Thermoanaerobaculia bacterium]|nr:SLC13 family permease [Thermoanaerobaculia bacterium]